MTKTKSTRSALVSSVLALLLCFSMLLGTTFAWFTDSVSSSGNVIKAGNLDVEMEWKDATAAGAQKTYKDASEGAIFNYDKWEPGYVEAKNVKISNVGTLALKYHLNIAAKGEVSELANVIDVYYAEGEYVLADRSMTELTKIGTLADVLDGMPANMAGDLEAEKSDIVTIALKMQEDAGNEYKGLSIGTSFAVVLMATQDNVEADSFDENYDDIEIPDKDVHVIGGNTYYYTEDGNVVLASVPYGNVGASFTVPDDVTVLGQGNAYSEGKPVFSKSSPIETITLNEGLVEIKARAMTGIKTLTKVVFPSTLETIGVQSIAQSGIVDLTVPATVKEVKYGAFTASPNLKTVTIEGNALLDNYVFRDCGSLESVYLLGDDVQFVGGGMFATRKQSGDANGITIYVKNATVAARLYAAQSSAYGYEVKILGDAADGSDAQEVTQVKNDAAFDAAISSGEEVVVLTKGNYSMPDGGDGVSLRGKELTVVGSADTVIDVSNVDERDQFVTGATLKFEGVTLKFGTALYMGFANCKELVYKNCVIEGVQHLYGNSITFEGCTLNVTGDNYMVRTWGGKNVTFNNCTFNCDGKAILVYNQSCNLTVNNCVFNDNGDGTVSGKAAIEACNGDNGANCVTHNIVVNNTTVNGFDINASGTTTNSKLWANKNSLDDAHLNVTIDGVVVH